jgi:glycerate dehydrogenase
MARIVVLDSFTLNPGDLSWQSLEALGEVTLHDRTPADQILHRAADAQILLTNKAVLAGGTIRQLSSLRYIGVLATGYNVVDVDAARERGIVVTNVPAYGTPSVAQLVFALLLELTHHVGHHARTVREGRWTSSPDFCYWDFPLIELAGLTFGIAGLGRIGREVAKLADAFGMKVIANVHRPPASVPPYVRLVSLDDLFGQSDVISLHCPLTPETKELVNAQRLEKMKRTGFLINTGRGALVNEQDLAAALNAGRIGGAGLDVLSSEPPAGDNPLLSAKNCYITPHIAWATKAARERLMKTAVENVRAFLAGSPINRVA